MRFIASTFVLAILATSCLPSPTPRSEVQHTFGKTRREPKKPLENCQEQQPNDPALAAAQAYVKAIGLYVMQRNPQTFHGEFAPEKFCFAVQDVGSLNANASPQSRIVTFYAGLLNVMQNDGQIAAVMAHELSHITMQHVDGLEKEEVENDPRWQATSATLKQRITTLKENETNLYMHSDSLQNQKDDLDSTLDSQGSELLQQKRSALENQFYAITDRIAAILNKNGNPVYYGLMGKLLAPVPRIPHDPVFTVEGDEPSDAEYLDVRATVEKYVVDRNAWIAEEKQAFPQLWSNYENISNQITGIGSALNQNYIDIEKGHNDLNELRNAIMGSGAQNWMEKEADDVGLEFFLRAGFAPLNYQGIFEHFAAEEKTNAATCAILNNNHTPERGTGSHPSACWRYYNAQILEIQDHAKDFQQFLGTALSTEIFPGQLNGIQKDIAARPSPY